MAPVIPSPTPITGVRSTGGKPSLRLPIDVFQSQYQFAFALYVQALAAWQKDGNEQRDKDNSNGTSYFQVAGVHGVPYVPWQNDPTAPATQDPTVGYCTHRSVLFMPWHRPYLMLYEQIIYAYAQEIAKNATGFAAKAYANALPNVRLPYWDWANNPHLPAVIMTPDVTLTIPGQKENTTDKLHLPRNPLYSYQFTSDWATALIQKEMQWHQNDAWAESKRCPEANGKSNQAVADKQVATFTTFKSLTFQAITQVTDFDEFTTQAWRFGQGPQAYTSIESMHNNIHNYVGTNDTVLKDPNTKRLGNMTDVQASSFDPVFWLHHVNCDRLVAIWQALNPDPVINAWESQTDRFTANAKTMEDGSSRLEPWHKTASPSTADYFIANDTRQLLSTFGNGYYYPETPLELIQDEARMKAYATQQIYRLYAPQSLRGPALKQPKAGNPVGQKPIDSTPVGDLLPNQTVSHWQAFLRVKNFALTGTWAVHIFLGEVPSETSEWFMSKNRIGSVTMLSNRSRQHCQNCVSQAESGQLVTGTVPLTEALQERDVDANDEQAVIKYLKDNLSWRVAKDTQNVPISDDLTLTVGVSAQEVTLPQTSGELPTWGEPRVFPEATAGKTGGLNEQNRERLSL